MRAQFGGRFNALESKIDVLTTAVSDGRKPRWDTWAAWLAVGVTIVGGGAWAIDRRFGDQEARADRMHSAMTLLSEKVVKNDATTVSSLQRTETQLKGISDILNLTTENNRNWISEHHHRLYGHPLPDKHVWPEVGRDVGVHER